MELRLTEVLKKEVLIMSKLRAAVVGVGYLGNFHAQKYKNNSNVDLIGVCDYSTIQAEKVAQELQVKVFAKAQDLIGQVDLVTIAASTQSHFELAKLFIENGIHVNIEKPVTANLEQAHQLLQLQKLMQGKNVIISVGHIERFNPSVLELKKYAQSVRHIELDRMAPFKSRGADVSVLHDLMIHDLDILNYLFPEQWEVVQYSGNQICGGSLDTAQVSLKSASGRTAYIHVSRVNAVPVRQIRFIGKSEVITVQSGTHDFERITRGTDQEPMRIEKWQLDKADALQKETDAFIQAVQNQQSPEVPLSAGILAMTQVEEILAKILLKNKQS